MKEIVSYQVIDLKDRWMGSYNAGLKHPTSPLEMAIQNATQSKGVVYAIYNDGEREEVYRPKSAK
mgnify:FL=1